MRMEDVPKPSQRVKALERIAIFVAVTTTFIAWAVASSSIRSTNQQHGMHPTESSEKLVHDWPTQRQLPQQKIADRSLIVGGTAVISGTYPAFVWTGAGGSMQCGGTLIYSDVVLTAAACSSAFGVGNTIYVGATLQGGSDGEANTVGSTVSYPNYNSANNQNDIMLVKLTKPSTKTPLTLNSVATVPPDNATVTFVGFGSTAKGGLLSSILLQVNVSVLNSTTCAALYGTTLPVNGTIQLCAGTLTGGKDACQGDAGGPMLYQGAQVGIISNPVGCGQANIPEVSTRVSAYSSFIAQTICQISSSPPTTCPKGVPTSAPTSAPKPSGKKTKKPKPAKPTKQPKPSGSTTAQPTTTTRQPAGPGTTKPTKPPKTLKPTKPNKKPSKPTKKPNKKPSKRTKKPNKKPKKPNKKPKKPAKHLSKQVAIDQCTKTISQKCNCGLYLNGSPCPHTTSNTSCHMPSGMNKKDFTHAVMHSYRNYCRGTKPIKSVGKMKNNKKHQSKKKKHNKKSMMMKGRQ